MRQKALIFWCAMVVAALTAGCEKASPTRPTGVVDSTTAKAESMTDARTGATLIAAQPVTPAPNAQVSFGSQPLTLTVSNGTTTGTSPLTYTFEVATDAGFAEKVFTRGGVPQGAGGRTALAIDKLAGSKTYYWRVGSSIATGPGPTSAVRSFTVGPEIILQNPVPSSPAPGATGFAPYTLTVVNIQRSGPVGAIRYEFQLAASDNFANLISSAIVDEQPTQTSATTNANLTPNGTYFWRVRAFDATNNVSTPFSAPAPFTAQAFSVTRAIFHDNPADTGLWPQGAKITSIEFTGSSFRVDFDRRTGPNRWPDVPFGSGDLQYTLGMCVNIAGQWHCSAVVQFWYGRDLDASAPPSAVGREWFYDAGRWGPMLGYQPSEGETVGIFVAAGDLRNNHYSLATCPRVCEISDVVLVPFTNGYSLYANRK
jgi:hypothetical protein